MFDNIFNKIFFWAFRKKLSKQFFLLNETLYK